MSLITVHTNRSALLFKQHLAAASKLLDLSSCHNTEMSLQKMWTKNYWWKWVSFLCILLKIKKLLISCGMIVKTITNVFSFRGHNEMVWFFTINKYDRFDRSVRSDRNKKQFLGTIIFPVLARLWVLHQIINTYNSKEYQSTSRYVRSRRADRNAYRENYGDSRLVPMLFQFF